MLHRPSLITFLLCFVAVPMESRVQKKILDVGCGQNKFPGAIGLDSNPRTDADVIHDLSEVPYPFPDNEFDEVIGSHVAEHVPDVMAFVSELYRIVKPGGIIRLVTPHYTNPDWATDPTHRNHFNSYSFRYFTREKSHIFPFYTEIELRPLRTYVTLANVWKCLGLEWVVNADQRLPSLRFLRKLWEHYFSYLFRGKELRFEFEVVKPPSSTSGGSPPQ